MKKGTFIFSLLLAGCTPGYYTNYGTYHQPYYRQPIFIPPPQPNIWYTPQYPQYRHWEHEKWEHHKHHEHRRWHNHD